MSIAPPAAYLPNLTKLAGQGPVEGFVLDLTEIWSDSEAGTFSGAPESIM